MEFGIKLSEEEYKLLLNFMEKNKIKTKAKAIKKCIKLANDIGTNNDLLYEMNNKLNRLVYRDTLTKKLVEQVFSNMGFAKNIDPEKDKCLYEFYLKNDPYKKNDF